MRWPWGGGRPLHSARAHQRTAEAILLRRRTHTPLTDAECGALLGAVFALVAEIHALRAALHGRYGVRV